MTARFASVRADQHHNEDTRAARPHDRSSLRRRRPLRARDGEELGLSTDEQELFHTAGLFHDIGKFIFPDSILFAARG